MQITSTILAVAAVAAALPGREAADPRDFHLSQEEGFLRCRKGLSKLPWKEPGFSHVNCSDSQGYSELDCGTQIYCEAFDDDFEKTDKKFPSVKACFDAHEKKDERQPSRSSPTAQKLPWDGYMSPLCNSEKYGIGEVVCGTHIYCMSFHPQAPLTWGNDGKYKSDKECFDAHEPASGNSTPTVYCQSIMLGIFTENPPPYVSRSG
ncbi:hypothetical protein CDD80_3657 [Ophiocordyceps camponoti-rufipedis]|uniref:Ig-like domain-containing protein n=1 Tax=Ophiocordyceps camponoti-rufipedis TaxID=2004952 RepID=A0A2C5Z1X1_9HYPO|nr:hypothetical protein CDD80_3657 [Ophiocordyceps camponoti-rufipedis]